MALRLTYRHHGLRLTATLIAFLGLVWANAACAQSSAAPVEYQKPISNRLNNTGQPLTVPVQLKDGKRDLGEIMIRVLPDDSLLIPKSEILEKFGSILQPEILARLNALPQQDDRLPLEAIRTARLNLNFNSALFELVLEPNADQRTTGDLSVGELRGTYASANTTAPAKVSGYVNILGGVDESWQTQAGRPAQTGGHLELQGVLRLRGIVLETEGVYDGIVDANRCNIGSLCTYDHTEGVKRRSSRLTYDMPDQQLRLQVGDTEAQSATYVKSIDTLGVSLEKTARKLAPGENIRPVGRGAFRIDRASEVDVIVNGAVIQHFQLQPGQYNLRDLPFTTGANDLELGITDDSGERRTLKFSSFYDANQLAAGKSEWAVSAGAPSYVLDNARKYETSSRVGTGLLRHGITDEITIEASAQADSNVVAASAGVFLQTPVGLVNIQPAFSNGTTKIGRGVTATWDIAGVRGPLGLRESIHLGADYRDKKFHTPGDQIDLATKVFLPQSIYKLRLVGSHSISWDNDLTTTLSARYQFDDPEAPARSRYVVRGDRYGADVSLSKPFAPWISGSLLLGYSNETYLHGFAANFNNTKPEFRAAARVFIRPAARTSVNASYDTLNKSTQVSATQSVGDGIDRWDSNVSVQRFGDTGSAAAAGSIGYAGNRAEVRVTHSGGFEGINYPNLKPTSSDERTSVRVGTAIAFADGLVAVGAPIRNGAFAIVKPHASIADKDVLIKNGETVIAKSDSYGPAVVSSLPTYANSTIPVDVPDLPVGYSLGSGGFDVHPPLRAGYALEVGSSYSVTAFGTLLNAAGDPIALQTGVATTADDGAKKIAVFTNAQGRFGADGLAPGRWKLRMDTADGPVDYILDIPADTESLFKAGTLKPSGKG